MADILKGRPGRKKGKPAPKTSARKALAEKAIAAGITPLEYMLEVMRTEIPENADPLVKVRTKEVKFEAAKAAAPYIHPRLNAVEHSGPDGGAIKFEEVVRRIV